MATKPDGAAVQARETDDNIFGEVFVDFEEVAVVDDGVDGVFDVVGLLRIVGNQGVERFIAAIGRIGSGAARRIFEIVGGKKTHQLANHRQAIGIIAGDEMSDAAFFVVGHGAAELLLGDFLMRDGFDDVGAGHEHVRSFAGHENKIGDGRRIDRAARARAHDGADLRDDAAGQSVAQKNVGVAGERSDAFLNARAAGIVQADQRSAGAHGEIHNFADFSGVGFGERAAEHREILRENVDEAAVDAAKTGDEAVARQGAALPCRNRRS